MCGTCFTVYGFDAVWNWVTARVFAELTVDDLNTYYDACTFTFTCLMTSSPLKLPLCVLKHNISYTVHLIQMYFNTPQTEVESHHFNLIEAV